MESDGALDLQDIIKKLEEEQLKSAQLGLQLVESQSRLQRELNRCRDEMTAMTENYEQEKLNLLKEVELKKQMIKALRSELDIMKQDITNLEKL